MKIASLLRGEYDFFRGAADLFYLQAKESCADWFADTPPASSTTAPGSGALPTKNKFSREPR